MTEKAVLPAKTALGGKIVDGKLSLCSSSIAERELAADEVQFEVNASEFQADDLQSNHGTPRIVVRKIISVGNGVDTAKIGQVISIAAYGLDSMSGAELRNWLFNKFGLDMGFQTLLTPTLTFKALSMTVDETLGVLKAQA